MIPRPNATSPGHIQMGSDLAQIATDTVECRTDLATEGRHSGNRRNRDKGGNKAILDGGGAPIVAEEFDNLSHVSFPCLRSAISLLLGNGLLNGSSFDRFY